MARNSAMSRLAGFANPLAPIDPATKAMYTPLDQLPVAQSNRAPSQQAHDQKRRRATYDVPQWVIDAVAGIAQTLQVPHGDVAAHLLAVGLQAYERGDLNLMELRIGTRSLRSEFKLPPPTG